MAQQTKPQGIKSFTKPHSVHVRLANGGKEYVRDASKTRMYKVKWE